MTKFNITEEEFNKADAILLGRSPSLKECTREERFRFVQGLGITNLDDVQKKLCAYLQFRENDLKRHREHLSKLNPGGSLFDESFYRSVTITEERAKDKTRIAHILPATFRPKDDKNIQLYRKNLTSAKYHALTIACYLDSMLQRNSHERLTIVVDVRYGEGENFGNASLLYLLPVLREAVLILQNMFQERLRKIIMFPMHSGIMYAWKIIKRFIDKDSLFRYTLIGANKENSIPIEIREIIDLKVIAKLEQRRRSMFDIDSYSTGDSTN